MSPQRNPAAKGLSSINFVTSPLLTPHGEIGLDTCNRLRNRLQGLPSY